MAANAGYKDHPDRSQAGHAFSVVSGAAGEQFRGQVQLPSGVFDELPQTRVGQRGAIGDDLLEAEFCSVSLCDLLSLIADFAKQHVDAGFVQIAGVETQDHFPRYDVVSPGYRLNPADRAHLAPGDAGYNAVHCLNEFRSLLFASCAG